MSGRKYIRQNQLKRLMDREAGASAAVQLVVELFESGDPAARSFPQELVGGLRRAASLATEREIVMLYVEFEDAVREAYRHILKRNGHPKMQPLLFALSNVCPIPEDVYMEADKLRECRNRIIHDGQPTTMSISEGKRAAARFIACLFDWTEQA